MLYKVTGAGVMILTILACQRGRSVAAVNPVAIQEWTIRGIEYISTQWDKQADIKYAETRRKLVALWEKYREGDVNRELKSEYFLALRAYRRSKDSRDLLYALGVSAFATMLCDGEYRKDLKGAWQTAKGNKSLEFARGIYLYEMSGTIDFKDMIPIGKALLERDPTDEPVLIRYAHDVNMHAPGEARGFLQVIRPRLDQAYSHRLWAAAAAGVYISAKPTNATERYEYALTAFQLLARYEAMTGKKTYMGSKQLQINYHKYYPKDKPFAEQPPLFGPNAVRSIGG